MPHDGCDVVITGLGMTTPLGGNTATTWEALLSGRSGARKLDEKWVKELPVQIACPVQVEPSSAFTTKQARRLDRSQQMAIIAGREAWAHAGCPGVESERLAVSIGTGIGGGLTILEQDNIRQNRGSRLMSPFTIPMLMPNGSAAVVGLELGARGGAHAPVSACASGAEAIAIALTLIRSGQVDVVVAGGTDACLHPLAIGGFTQMGALSMRNDAPRDASRPFSRDRDGFVIAEGAAAIVLERGEFAAARGARVHGRLVGAGVTSDAFSLATPDSGGQVRAIEIALRTGELSSADVGHVNAHATGTLIGDRVEAEALYAAMGQDFAVTATKSLTGHPLGAAGAIEAIFTVLSLREGIIPATHNLAEQDHEVQLDIVAGVPRRHSSIAAISNSFGFGGHNVVLAFAR